jgi:hypothetical protein
MLERCIGRGWCGRSDGRDAREGQYRIWLGGWLESTHSEKAVTLTTSYVGQVAVHLSA